jgi:hypothetical protein
MDFLSDIHISVLAVFIAALVYFILGEIWYSSNFFGKHWRKHESFQAVSSSSSYIGTYMGEFILDLLIAYVLALFIGLAGATNWIDGLSIAFWLWLGFVATSHLSAMIWTHKSFKGFLVHAGFMLLGLLIMAGILIQISSF